MSDDSCETSGTALQWAVLFIIFIGVLDLQTKMLYTIGVLGKQGAVNDRRGM